MFTVLGSFNFGLSVFVTGGVGCDMIRGDLAYGMFYRNKLKALEKNSNEIQDTHIFFFT